MQRFIFSGIIAVAVMFSGLTGCTTVVRTPPPPARVDVRPATPFQHAVWIDGRWDYRHGDWVWLPGHRAKRPKPGANWAPGHWQKTPRGWKLVPGHWR